MSALGRHVAEYLALRRSLGFKLEREEQLLAQFVAYIEAAGQEHVTGELAIAWAKLPVAASPNQWAKRLGVVRRFAVYLVTMDPATEVPPSGIFPTTRRRLSPYLFSDSDIERVLVAARGLAPPLRAATHEALFGLLAVSGMRIGEAIGLARGDVDLNSGIITIRHAKFDRTRFVPLHESSTAALSVYAATRDRLCRQPRAEAFFCTSVGTALDRSGVGKTFRQITTALGLRTATTHPRVHDLRHCFAVRTLINWQRQGASIDGHLATLSGYLGHVAPSDTYWYYSDSRVIPIPASLRA
ncbi:MAG: tyrosine-type recombinase/integrase [Streptosporangiales bacterium]|nr:tyrosine-type recombinase/integrase [Streptosporangiales bacterium]